MKNAQQHREDIIDAIIEEMENGTAPWEKPWQMLCAHKNGHSGHSYKGINAFYLGHIAMTKGYKTPLWITWKDCKALNGHPKQNQWDNSYPILYASKIEKDRIDANGQPVLDSSGNPEKNVFWMQRFYMVWNVEQTTVDPKRYKKYMVKATNVSGNERRSDIEATMKKAVDVNLIAAYEEVHQDRAFYSPSRDRITMPEFAQFNTADNYYSTLFHEAIHSTGHKSRLSRGLEGSRFGTESYAAEELVAEFGAALIGAEFQINGTSQHASYIKNWAARCRKDPTILNQAINQAKKAAAMITKVKVSTEKSKEIKLVTNTQAPKTLKPAKKRRGSKA